MNDEQSDVAGVIAPPPLIFLAALATGLLLDRAYPLRLLPQRLARLLGWPMIAVGGGLDAWAVLTMARARTHVEPWRPTTAIVDGGPFAFTRNPIYLGFALTYVGVALVRNALAPLLLLPVALGVIRRGVIEREERYLQRKFGAVYTDYQARVRRWL
jgi:protein-S-isoprenylcysteine O-methyltransferase Ste14